MGGSAVLRRYLIWTFIGTRCMTRTYHDTKVRVPLQGARKGSEVTGD